MRSPRLLGILCACIALPAHAAGAEFDCVADPRQVVEIRSPVEGLIEKISVERGDFVTAGQVV